MNANLRSEQVRGDKNPNNKLTTAIVKGIISQMPLPYGAIKALAKKHKVSHKTVSAIVQGKRWTWLPRTRRFMLRPEREARREGSMDALVRNLIFCSSCDYVMDKLERDSLRCRPDAVTCPRCHAVNLTQFYSYGSQTHRDRRDAWERGEIKGAPLPFPKRRS